MLDTDTDIGCCCCYCTNAKRTLYLLTHTHTVNALQNLLIHSTLRSLFTYSIVYSITYAQFNHYDIVFFCSFALTLNACMSISLVAILRWKCRRKA